MAIRIALASVLLLGIAFGDAAVLSGPCGLAVLPGGELVVAALD